MWAFGNFNFRKPTHNSNINLQVECAPLHKCARPRLAVWTGGAAKSRKGTNNKYNFKNRPKIVTSKIDSLIKYNSQE